MAKKKDKKAKKDKKELQEKTAVVPNGTGAVTVMVPFFLQWDPEFKSYYWHPEPLNDSEAAILNAATEGTVVHVPVELPDESDIVATMERIKSSELGLSVDLVQVKMRAWQTKIDAIREGAKHWPEPVHPGDRI